MEKLNFVFLIRDDRCWEQLFSHIANLSKLPAEVDRIAVVAVGTALLSYLKSTRLDALKATIFRLANDNVKFYLCTNSLSRYGIEESMLLPEVHIAHQGGLVEVARFESQGYHSVTLG